MIERGDLFSEYNQNYGIDTPTQRTAAVAEQTFVQFGCEWIFGWHSFGQLGRARICQWDTVGQFRRSWIHDAYSAASQYVSDAGG